MPPNQLMMAEVQNESGKKKKSTRRGSPRNTWKNTSTRSFSRSPPESPVRGVLQKDACFVTDAEGPDSVLDKPHIGIQFQENVTGRLSPFSRSPVVNGCVGGYNVVQAPAPTYLPPPPPSWMVTNFKVVETASCMPKDMGFLSTHLKMLLKVQG